MRGLIASSSHGRRRLVFPSQWELARRLSVGVGNLIGVAVLHVACHIGSERIESDQPVCSRGGAFQAFDHVIGEQAVLQIVEFITAGAGAGGDQQAKSLGARQLGHGIDGRGGVLAARCGYVAASVQKHHLARRAGILQQLAQILHRCAGLVQVFGGRFVSRQILVPAHLASVARKREHHRAGVGVETLQHVCEVYADRDLGDARVQQRIDGVSLPRQFGREIGCVLSSPLQLTEAALFRIVVDADHQGELLFRQKARGVFRRQRDAFAAALRGGERDNCQRNGEGATGSHDR